MIPKGPRRRLAREEVEDALRGAIIGGSLRPGMLVTEMQLADALGFSRVPVREALRTLVAEGFVEVLHGRGVRVAGIDLMRVRDEFELRLVLEPAAVAIACQRVAELDLGDLETITADLRGCIESDDFSSAARLNAEFHHAVIRLAQNSQFDKLLPGIWSSLRLTLLLSNMNLSVAVLNHDLEEQHLKLIEALRDRDATRARAIAATHIRESYRNHRLLVSGVHDVVQKISASSPDEAGLEELFDIPLQQASVSRLDLEWEEEADQTLST